MQKNMKSTLKFWISGIIALTLQSHGTLAQSIDEDRMNRDIEVAENVLATVIKQQLSDKQTFFGLDVKGSYQPGYGITFRLPPDRTLPFVISIDGPEMRGAAVISNGNRYSYSVRTQGAEQAPEDDNSIKLKERTQITADSVRARYYEGMISAAQAFILDYGDLLSQLQPHERIVVTNQSDRPNLFFNGGRRTRISVEGTRQDITALRQGKINREQALKKLTVVNTESVEAREPDMEMLSSIFSRLYRPDLSKTYFIEGNVYYERLKDFGTIFYMQMISSIENNFNRFMLPTLGLEDLDQESRDKKVTELYPAFEAELKENILEYGRTVKSLNDNESLIFNISLTKCQGCGIPASLELGIKASVLKEFGTGKIDKSAAMKKFSIKRGVSQ